MTARYTILVEPTRDLVRITMSGFFTPDDVARFMGDRDVAHARLRCAPNQHVTINDLRGMKIQSQESVAAFNALLSSPRHRSRRLAFVIGTTLARMQLLRVVGNRSVRFFDDPRTAEAWVMEPQEELRRAG